MDRITVSPITLRTKLSEVARDVFYSRIAPLSSGGGSDGPWRFQRRRPVVRFRPAALARRGPADWSDRALGSRVPGAPAPILSHSFTPPLVRAAYLSNRVCLRGWQRC